MRRKESNVPVCGASSRCQHSRVLRTPSDGLDCCLVLMELHEFLGILHGIDHEFVIVAARSNERSVVTPLEPADLLAVSLVFLDDFGFPAVPDSNLSVSGSASENSSIGVPIEASHSPRMPVEHLQRFLFCDVEQPDLAHGIADGNVVGIAGRECH